MEINPINLPVHTQSDEKLGVVIAVVYDQSNEQITHYEVKPVLLKRLKTSHFFIHQSQVIAITPEKMIVEDTTTKVPIMEFKKMMTSPATE